MQIQRKRLTEVNGSLNAVLGTAIDFKLAYRMRKLAGKILSALKDIEKYRSNLVVEMGVEKVKGRGEYSVPDEKVADFKKKFEAYLEGNVDIGGEKIPYGCVSAIKISAMQLAFIEDLIDEPTGDDIGD